VYSAHLGPGTYETKSGFGKEGGFRFDLKGEYNPANTNPGPGTYNANYNLVEEGGHSQKMSKGLR
jgi:Sperm-tail PG-rich repeat